jgi:hypothetical protein
MAADRQKRKREVRRSNGVFLGKPKPRAAANETAASGISSIDRSSESARAHGEMQRFETLDRAYATGCCADSEFSPPRMMETQE